MAEPTVAQNLPVVLELEPGSYWWCACGLSKSQPWCDGSHAGTEFEPQEVVITEKRRYALCQCKHAQRENMPFCDGSHKRFP